MPGTTETLLIYYLGLGFVILLGWAAALPTRQLDEATARRYIRAATIAAVVGLLHPAIALSARDIIGQVGVELPDGNPTLRHRRQRAATVINALTIASLIPLAAVVAVQLA